MAARDWFGVIDVSDDSSNTSFFMAVLALLERVRPTEVDRTASKIVVTPSSVEFEIVHRSIAEASIEMIYRGDYGASFSIITFAEEYYLPDKGCEPVSDQMLDELELLLTRVYTVKKTSWRGKPVRTEICGPRPYEDPSSCLFMHLLTPFHSLLPKASLVTTVRQVSFRPQGTDR